MTDDTIRNDDTGTQRTPIGAPAAARADNARPMRARRGLVVGLIAAPLALGAVGLSLAQSGSRTPTAAPEPTAIAALAPSSAVAAKGEVAEIFGNKFVVQDATGRALVETGRQGEDGKLVARGETVTVQGRFEHGFLHARAITRADGTQVAVGPAGGPPQGVLDWTRDKVGLGPKPDLPALTASVERAGYTDVRVTGRGPRHVEVAARGADGRDHALHVDFDGRVREKPAL